MDQKWNLKRIYKGFDSFEFQEDLLFLSRNIDDMIGWSEESFKLMDNACEKLEEYIRKLSSINNTFTKLYYFSFLTLSIDYGNEEAGRYLYITESKYNEVSAAVVKFKRWLRGINNIEEVIIKSSLLEEHRYFLMESLEKSRYLLSDAEEYVISKMKSTGSDAWSALRNMLLSRVVVDVVVDGEKKSLPLPAAVMNLEAHEDPEVRRSVHAAKTSAFSRVEASISACLNGIKGEVITQAQLRGYISVLDKTLMDYRMPCEILEVMMHELQMSLPSLRRFYVRKAELLGVPGSLPIYDAYAPVGISNIRFSNDQMVGYITEKFRSFSSALGDFAKEAFTMGWIDSEPREGRGGYGFCYNIDDIKESRILINFDGGIRNITSLSHELGHAYHFSRLARQSILNREYTPPISETASIFFETMVKNSAIRDVSAPEKRVLLDASLSDTISLIFGAYSAFLFESKLFEVRKEHPLSLEELGKMAIDIQKSVYGEVIDFDSLSPYIWLNKPHFYSADYNFYNFPYIFGLLFARGLYSEYLRHEDKFVESFDRMLEFSAGTDLLELGRCMGIDLDDRVFWRNSLKGIEDEINEYINS